MGQIYMKCFNRAKFLLGKVFFKLSFFILYRHCKRSEAIYFTNYSIKFHSVLHER